MDIKLLAIDEEECGKNICLQRDKKGRIQNKAVSYVGKKKE